MAYNSARVAIDNNAEDRKARKLKKEGRFPPVELELLLGSKDYFLEIRVHHNPHVIREPQLIGTMDHRIDRWIYLHIAIAPSLHRGGSCTCLSYLYRNEVMLSHVINTVDPRHRYATKHKLTNPRLTTIPSFSRLPVLQKSQQHHRRVPLDSPVRSLPSPACRIQDNLCCRI